MPDLSWKTIVQIGGTTLTTAAGPTPVEAIDTVEVLLAPGDSEKVVDLQPGGAAAIRLLVIKSSLYGEDIVYKAGDGTTDSDVELTLDGPQIFTAGSVALFGLDPRQLKFSNASADKKATVMILVARDATP